MAMTGNEIRETFLNYFKNHEHRIVKSASLVPHDDKTLLFTNAGMVQFKRIFIGEEKRDYTRATTSQKCVRAGGKHNDLENVGHTARHHTFFEMLGNFSFGDYFKDLAIELSWDLLTRVYGLPKDKLWISVFTDDDEAAEIWENKIGVPAERIVRLGEKDNFWSMGDTGPCGPCSEIHIDRGPEFGCDDPDCAVGCDCDRWLEIWNLVFMQFNRDENGNQTPLPKPSIDTGMGLERIASVLQDTPTNYETDLFTPIMDRLAELSGKKMGDSAAGDIAMKVIADHSRAAAFLVGDGILPSNEGRGYVLRRIMRRAIRYGRYLGLEKPFLHETAKTVCEIMQGAYPELLDSLAFIQNVVENEEIRFRETLDHGLKILNDAVDDLAKEGTKTLPGAVIFKLYDTYGFPVDIVEDHLADTNISLDMPGFRAAMDEQKARSKKTVTFDGAGEAVAKLSGQGVKTRFVGYDQIDAEGKVLLIVKDGEETEKAVQGDTIRVVTDQTPFYGESGGQAGDVGIIKSGDLRMDVTHTVKDPTGLFIHEGTVTAGDISKDQLVHLLVDAEKRRATVRNHSATHLLHAALRRVVGDHAKQSGSLVAPERLRFDFTHFSALTREQMDEIEDIVNRKIRWNLPVSVVEMDAEAAQKSGATALFEEKYGDTVRVISMGDFSKELCGGTHANSTGDIGLFLITGESSVAAGVRRIEAVTGRGAFEYARKQREIAAQAAALVKDSPENLVERVQKTIAAQKAAEKEVAQLKTKMATMAPASGGDQTREINGVKVMAQKVPADNPNALRDAADQFKSKIGSGIVVLGAKTGPKAFIVCMVTKDLTKKYQAGTIIKKIAPIVGGGGGGKPDMAQAGGSDPSKLDEAMEEVFKIVENW